MNLKERILKFISHLGIQKSEFEKMVGLSNDAVNKMGENTRKSTLDKISKSFPELNMSWVRTGVGEMLAGNTVAESPQPYRKTTNPNAVIIDQINLAMIPLVSQYAYAGYLSGYADTEYVETLPKLPVIVDHQLKGEYMAFEVKGDSMEDGTADSLRSGDILICRNIKQEHWRNKLHINKWNFIIAHKTEGILVKRIIAHDVENGTITIHSLNDMYEDKVLSLNDVSMLFNVTQVQRNGAL